MDRGVGAVAVALLVASACRFDPVGVAGGAHDGAPGAPDAPDGPRADGPAGPDGPWDAPAAVDAAAHSDASGALALAFASPPGLRVIEGGCAGPLTIEHQDGAGGAVAVGAPLGVSLSASEPARLTLHGDASCGSTTAAITIAAGASQASFYVKGLLPGDVAVTAAAAGRAPAAQDVSVLPIVTRGECALEDGAGEVDCAIGPALLDREKAFLVFQAISARADPTNTSVRCRLVDTATIACDRNGTTGRVEIAWQAVQRARGLAVEHLEPACTGQVTSVPIAPVADVDHTFLLFSTRRDGGGYNADDYRTAYLTAADRVELRFSGGGCSAVETALQVVQLEGAAVTRGRTGPVAGFTVTSVVPPTGAAGRTFLLWSARLDPTGSELCERMPRGALATELAVVFTRGLAITGGCADEPIDDIAWERIVLPAGDAVRQLYVMAPDTFATATVDLDPPVIDHRTLVLSGGQWASGQGLGEGSHKDGLEIGAMIGLHRLAAPDRLDVARGAALGTTLWTSYVIELGI